MKKQKKHDRRGKQMKKKTKRKPRSILDISSVDDDKNVKVRNNK